MNAPATEFAELKQKELCKRWNVSISTVRRIVKEAGEEPIKWIGLNPVFSPAQADRMYAQWQRGKADLIDRLSRTAKRAWRRRKKRGGTSAKVLSLDEVKRRAAR